METASAYTHTDYQRFRDLILERSGLYFAADKQQTLMRGVSEARVGTPGCTSLEQYHELLRSSASTDPVWDRLVSILTVGETYFFRNNGHFDAFAKRIMPEIIAERRNASPRIRIWCAGCATGEEPYSIAMQLHDLLPDIRAWNIFILATDLNRDALRRAREGLYGSWSFRGVEKRIQDRYFHAEGGRYAISEEIKRMVVFDYLNLMEDSYPSLAKNTQGMDVIFCRNVTIYFTAEITQRVVNKFERCLVEGGWYIPGPSEPNMVTYQSFEQHNLPGAVIFRKSKASRTKPQAAGLVAPPSAALGISPPMTLRTALTPSLPRSAPPAVKPLPLPSMLRSRPAPAAPVVAADPYEAGLALLQAGRVDDALARFYEKVDQEPSFARVYYVVGKIKANRGELDEAQRWCERAVERDRLLPEAYYILSMIYQENGLPAKALEALKKVVYLAPDFVLAHYNLGCLYRQQGSEALATKAFQNALHALAGKPDEALVSEGDGMIVARLRQLVDMQLNGAL